MKKNILRLTIILLIPQHSLIQSDPAPKIGAGYFS